LQDEHILKSPGIDEQDSEDPLACPDYVKDIFDNMKAIETKYMPDPDYMSKQTDLQAHMRIILIDWLVEVHAKFELAPETLYLSVNILDRFLSDRTVSRKKLQLVGATAMFIASKYEEIEFPQVKHFVELSCRSFTREDMLKTERLILQSLDFNITVATPNIFIKRYVKCGQCTSRQMFIAYFFSEIALLDYKLIRYSPSTIACASIHLANVMTGEQNKWSDNLKYYTGRDVQDLEECASIILESFKKFKSQRRNNRNACVAVLEKYATHSRLKVSVYCMKRVEQLQL
jgi:hypothetical protein